MSRSRLGEDHIPFTGIALLLGAGASDFAGYQTFRTFGDLMLDPTLRLRDELPSLNSETPRLIEEIHEALGRMRRPTTHDNYLWLLNNYTDFCTKFEKHSGLQERFSGIFEQIHSFDQLATAAIGDITSTTYLHYSKRRQIPDAGEEVLSLYRSLARLNSSNCPFLPMFTTNYDLLLEDLVDTTKPNSLPMVNGIPGLLSQGERWTEEEYRKHFGLHLYRVHGCVGWRYKNYSDPDVYFRRNQQRPPDLLHDLCVMFPGREMFPGKNPHGFGFRHFYYTLRTCALLLVIGFSFRDDDLMHLLLAANAARERDLSILLVDPWITPKDVVGSLVEAGSRSPFPVKTPRIEAVQHLDKEFGCPGVKDEVLRFVADNQEE